MSRFNLLYILQYNKIVCKEYAWIMVETKSSDNISHVSLWGEQPKPNVDVGDILLLSV